MTFKKMAGEWMDYARDKNLQHIDEENIQVLKYTEHEEEFMTLNNPPAAPLEPPVIQKLKFCPGSWGNYPKIIAGYFIKISYR